MLRSGAAAQVTTSIGAGVSLHIVAHVELASASPLLLLQHAGIKLFLFSACELSTYLMFPIMFAIQCKQIVSAVAYSCSLYEFGEYLMCIWTGRTPQPACHTAALHSRLHRFPGWSWHQGWPRVFFQQSFSNIRLVS